jgi:hypothetical protein
VEVIVPSTNVTVGIPHASVAVAVPSAAVMLEAVGLQPRARELPLAVIDGGVTSLVQVTVRDAVEVLLHPSLAVHVLVCEREHPLVTTDPSINVSVVAPHASVAVAVPRAAVISEATGLQPKVNVVPVAVRDGGIRSSVQVAVRDVDDVLPQASIALNVLVCEREQPVLATVPSLEVTVGVPHASVAVAVPNAELMVATDGLQPRLKLVPAEVMVGAVWSNVHVTVLEVVDVLLHPSVAMNVLV